MSTTELAPQGTDNKLAKLRDEDQAKKTRAAYTARASSDFYGGVGWLVGLFITLVVSVRVIWFLTANASRSTGQQILIYGIAVAWWLNPLSLGALGYIFSNLRSWRLWTAIGLLVWAVVNLLISMSIISTNARIIVVNGLIVVGYILLALLFLYIQLRVFIWAAAVKPGRFFFGIRGWAAFNGLIYWGIISPEV